MSAETTSRDLELAACLGCGAMLTYSRTFRFAPRLGCAGCGTGRLTKFLGASGRVVSDTFRVAEN